MTGPGGPGHDFVTDGSFPVRGELLRAVVASTPDAILVIDPDAGRVRAANPAAGALLGDTPEALVDRAIADLFTDTGRLDTVLETALDEAHAWRDDLRCRTRDGRAVDVEVSASRLRIGEGVHVLAFLRDVTDRRTNGRASDEQYARLRAIVENAPIVLFTVDRDGVFTQSEGRGVDRLGLDPDEVIGTSIHDLDAAIAAPVARALDGDEVTASIDVAGGVFETVCRPVLGPDGDVEQVIGVGIDVTDRRRHRDQLERLNEATRELMAADSEAAIAEVAVTIAGGLVDRAASAVWTPAPSGDGLTPVASRPPGGGTHGPPDAAGPIPVDSRWMAVFEAGEPATVATGDAGDGGVFPELDVQSVHLVPLGRHGLLGVGVDDPGGLDETERDLVEILARNATAALDRAVRLASIREREAELTRQNERLEAFASVVSHDLRNPLNVLAGYIDLAREAGGAYLDEMDGTIRRMERLIEDVLALAREGRIVGTLEPVRLDAVAESAWADVATGPATLEVGTDARIVADAERLSRLLENLFRNAIEHADDAVAVRVGLLDAEAGFYIEDDGPGIPPGDRERVFEPAYSTASEGTGFGLAIVDEIATAHGWTVTATAGEVGGARFVVQGVDFLDRPGTGSRGTGTG